MLSTGRLHPVAPRHKDLLAARKAERAAAWERRSSFWPVEDLRRLEPSATSLPRQPFVPPDPNALRATYVRYRDALLEADRACDLVDELTKLAPDALTAGAMDTITQRYHDALGFVAVNRRALGKPLLSAWHYDPSHGAMDSCTFKDFWAYADFERLLVCRSVSPAGLISEQVFFAERLPFANDPRQRSIYLCHYNEERGKLMFSQQQVSISAYATTDPNAPPNPRRTERFLFSVPLVKPPSVSPGRVLCADKAHYVYSGHQSVCFFAGPSPTLSFELAAIDDLAPSERERARKRICVPAHLPHACPVCLESNHFFVIYAYCGHAQCCTSCMAQYFGPENLKSLQGHRCGQCRAPYPPDFPSKALDLEQARTSHTLDRRGILGRHGKWDALSTTLGFLQKGSLLPPSLEEIWDYDVEDHRERIRVHMGLTKDASAILWELCTAELVELCLGLREQGGRLWSLVETYVGFGGPSFFRLSYSAYGREEEEEKDASFLESVVSRWYSVQEGLQQQCATTWA